MISTTIMILNIKQVITKIINWIMANYATLKAAIEEVITSNGNYEISGKDLRETLKEVVNSLGANYQFIGLATPETDPGTPDQNVAYLAGPGTYPNFGPTTVKPGEIGIFKYNGTWDVKVVQTDTTTDVININAIANHPAGYATPALALADVPERYRKLGCTVVYKDDTTEMWVMMICVDNFTIGDDWWTDFDNNWKWIGPVELRSTGYDENYVLNIGLNTDLHIIDNLESNTPYYVLSAKQGKLLNEKIEGWSQEIESIDTTGVQLPRPLLHGMIITKIEGATKLILVGQFEEVITPADLPYKMQHNAYSVKTESGTATDVTIGVRGVLSDDFINVNDYYGHSAAYASAQAARADVALTERKKGLYITYLLSVDENTTLWVTDQFVGDDITDWGVADNWKVVGPVTVLQNTNTGHSDISVGNVTTSVASVKDINDTIINEHKHESTSFSGSNDSSETYTLNSPIQNGKKYIVKVVMAVDGTIRFMGFANSNSMSDITDTIFSGTISFKANIPQYFVVTATANAARLLIERRSDGADVTIANLDESALNIALQNQIDKLAINSYNEDLVNSSSNTISHDWDAVTTNTYAGGQTIVNGHRYLIRLLSATGGDVLTLATYMNTQIQQSLGGITLVANQPAYIRFNATADANRLRVAKCPAMTTILVDLDDVKDNVKNLPLMPNILATLEDKANSIIWNVGEIRYGVPDTTRTNYRYSSPILVKKGDIIIINSYYNMPNEFADVYLTDANGSVYYAISKYWGSKDLLYIADKDQYIAINIRYDSRNIYHWYSTDVYKEMLDFLANYGVFYPKAEYQNLFANISKASKTSTNNNNKKFALLHLSDIHGNNTNYLRLKDIITKYGGYVDDTILTGDMVGGSFQDNGDAMLYTPGFEKILLSIGNHDVYDHNGDAPSVDDPNYWATGPEKYQRYFQNIAQWGVTQPANAATLGLCYYYKDYDLSVGASGEVTIPKLRLIVLDPYGYDADQQTWLVNTLTDAKTNGYAVMIATHVPPVAGENDCSYPFATQWNSIYRQNIYGSYASRYTVSEGVSAMVAVDDFITAGGEFVCWICGHTHYDKVMTITSHPNQIVIVIGTANGTDMPFADMARTEFDYSYDLINAISVDTYNKVLSIARIGVKTDIWLRKRETISIDYINRTLIADN